MAERLKNFTFRGQGAGSKYDWGSWLNGEIWKLEKGKDFEVAAKDFRSICYAAAIRKAKTVRVHLGEDFVVIQALDKEFKS